MSWRGQARLRRPVPAHGDEGAGRRRQRICSGPRGEREKITDKSRLRPERQGSWPNHWLPLSREEEGEQSVRITGRWQHLATIQHPQGRKLSPALQAKCTARSSAAAERRIFCSPFVLRMGAACGFPPRRANGHICAPVSSTTPRAAGGVLFVLAVCPCRCTCLPASAGGPHPGVPRAPGAYVRFRRLARRALQLPAVRQEARHPHSCAPTRASPSLRRARGARSDSFARSLSRSDTE